MAMTSSGGDTAPFLQYHEPGIVDILILVSFFTFLWISKYISAKVIRAGIIGPIAVGIIYGEPLANILHHDWAETYLEIQRKVKNETSMRISTT